MLQTQIPWFWIDCPLRIATAHEMKYEQTIEKSAGAFLRADRNENVMERYTF